MPGQHQAEERPISSGSLPPPSGNGQSRHSQASCSLSEFRRRELEVGLAIKREQLAQMRIAAAEAEIATFEAQMAYEVARSASSNAHSSRLHAGNRERPGRTAAAHECIYSSGRPDGAPPAYHPADNSRYGRTVRRQLHYHRRGSEPCAETRDYESPGTLSKPGS